MKTVLQVFLAFILLGSCTQQPTSQANPFQQLLDSVYQEFPNTKGISLYIEAPDQQISWSGVVGWADSATQRPLKPQDPALMASITKTYMAAAILRLVEDSLLSLQDPIGKYLPDDLDSAFRSKGYHTDSIRIEHLCTHTSGIADYVSSPIFEDRSINQPSYQWTRREQIDLIFTEAMPVNPPGQSFAYSEVNHLLLGILLEEFTSWDFHTAVKKLLRFEEMGLRHTWWYGLEPAPEGLAPLAHQFATKLGVDSYSLHPSFDLYGGGGLASTPQDVARFAQLLFTGKLFDKPQTTELLYHSVPTADGKDNAYYLSIAKMQLGEFTAYGHGGFWGTTVQYLPELNCSIAVFLMERDEWERNMVLLRRYAEEISNGRDLPA